MITFEILCLAYKFVHKTCQTYISELIHRYLPGHPLRSFNDIQMTTTCISYSLEHLQDFSRAAPDLHVQVEDKVKIWIQLITWMCIITALISHSAAYSHGGSFAACSDMKPKHIRAQPQNPRKNYVTIHTNRSFYLPGDKVPLTVRSTRDFMGFFLQARRVLNDQVAGTFVFIPPGSKLLRCFEDGDTVTHSDKSLKRNLSFVWKSPDQPVGDIQFFVSVVQSYFVYWARIESTIVSGHMHKNTPHTLRSEALDMGTGLQSASKYSSPSPHTEVPYIMNSSRGKTMESMLHTVTGKGESKLSDAVSIIRTSPPSVTAITTRDRVSPKKDSPVLFPVSVAPQTLPLQNRTMNHSMNNRNRYHGDTTTSCTTCHRDKETVSLEITITSPRPTLPPDSLASFTVTSLPTQEMSKDPTTLNLEDSQSLIFPSTMGQQKHKPTSEIAANFLQQPETSVSNAKVEVDLESTPPVVTKTLWEPGLHGKGGEKGRGMHLAMTQLGILLGCSVALGMTLAAGLHCIHAQYCHKRTEVSFSQPDDNVITLRESGDMMHFKKIRENSFVLVQAEYNWITPALTAKSQ
ncbi:reelin domain-containing protein 1 [Hyperolius riggenbachi]|uniref:reelin domain-containing protein 1 n=1 Tax=Hyperolius riggenbachi TaxID=752182 RepID=UPI0035A27068